MTTRSARVLLAGIVLATSLFAIRYYDGHDFINSVWAPMHGLLAGLNPYDPADFEYPLRYHVPVVAGLYLPAALLLHAPLALLSPARSADVMAVLNAGLVWLGVLLLIPPRTARSCAVAALAGTLVVASAPAQDTIYLGQLSGWAFAGLALLVASLRRNGSAVWLPAVGASLVALKPQSAIPMFVTLAVMGHWRVLGRAMVMLTLASLPGAVLFLRAAGSWSAIVRTTRGNLELLNGLPPVDLANPSNLRIDLLGIVSHLHGPALTGAAWMMIAFLAATTGLALAARGGRGRTEAPEALTDPWVVTLISVYVVVSLYHLMYDQLLLYIGPVVAASQFAGPGTPSPRTRVVESGGVALVVAGLVFREGMRARLVVAGLPALAVRQAWVTIPTLITLFIVTAGLRFRGSDAAGSGVP